MNIFLLYSKFILIWSVALHRHVNYRFVVNYLPDSPFRVKNDNLNHYVLYETETNKALISARDYPSIMLFTYFPIIADVNGRRRKLKPRTKLI